MAACQHKEDNQQYPDHRSGATAQIFDDLPSSDWESDGSGSSSKTGSAALSSNAVSDGEAQICGMESLHGEERHVAFDWRNPLWPFATEAELWFSHQTQQKPRWSHQRINHFLAASSTPGFGITLNVDITSARQLYKKLDALVDHLGEEWRKAEIKVSGGSWAGNYSLYYLDAKKVLSALFRRPDLQKYMVYEPVVERDSSGLRIYSEMHTAEKWHRIQGELPPGAVIMAVIGGSDATQLTVLGGDQKAWPVYISLGNILHKARRKLSNECFILVGYLPFLKYSEDQANSAGLRRARRQIFHECMAIIFRDLIDSSAE